MKIHIFFRLHLLTFLALFAFQLPYTSIAALGEPCQQEEQIDHQIINDDNKEKFDNNDPNNTFEQNERKQTSEISEEKPQGLRARFQKWWGNAPLWKQRSIVFFVIVVLAGGALAAAKILEKNKKSKYFSFERALELQKSYATDKTKIKFTT